MPTSLGARASSMTSRLCRRYLRTLAVQLVPSTRDQCVLGQKSMQGQHLMKSTMLIGSCLDAMAAFEHHLCRGHHLHGSSTSRSGDEAKVSPWKMPELVVEYVIRCIAIRRALKHSELHGSRNHFGHIMDTRISMGRPRHSRGERHLQLGEAHLYAYPAAGGRAVLDVSGQRVEGDDLLEEAWRKCQGCRLRKNHVSS